MASNKILLQAKAKKAGIDGYRQMSESELQDAINNAQGAQTAKKGSATKGSTSNGSTTKGSSTKGSASKGSTAKGSASKTAPAKSKTQKTAPAKGTAAKGTAKRSSTAAGKGSTSKAAKGNTSKAKTSTAKSSSTPKRGKQGRVEIDRKAIDWHAESNVGKQPGKRQDVMNALIKRKGNYDKVFEDLAPNALKYYPNALNSFPTAPSKRHAAELMLRWLINRVAYDFVLKSGQHKPGKRAGYGESDTTQNIRRRERREEMRKQREKEARAAKRNASKGSRKK